MSLWPTAASLCGELCLNNGITKTLTVWLFACLAPALAQIFCKYVLCIFPCDTCAACLGEACLGHVNQRCNWPRGKVCGTLVLTALLQTQEYSPVQKIYNRFTTEHAGHWDPRVLKEISSGVGNFGKMCRPYCTYTVLFTGNNLLEHSLQTVGRSLYSLHENDNILPLCGHFYWTLRPAYGHVVSKMTPHLVTDSPS
jgi:hypothetical protein